MRPIASECNIVRVEKVENVHVQKNTSRKSAGTLGKNVRHIGHDCVYIIFDIRTNGQRRISKSKPKAFVFITIVLPK
jgi:hypothetical protein